MSKSFDDPFDGPGSSNSSPEPTIDLPPLQIYRELDITVPHSARIWNYWLGGKDNYPVDWEVGDRIATMLPSIVTQARADRMFICRVVRFLAGEMGIRQFLDIGTGLPTADNTHEVAQRVAPGSRIVYVDNDPLVLTHARALLTSAPEGACAYIDGDLHDPDHILDVASETIDFSRPVAIMLVGILHHIESSGQTYDIVRRLVDRVSSGSFLVINHATNVIHGGTSDAAVAEWNKVGKPTVTLRSPEQLDRYFEGLELVDPGLVSCSRWRPETRAFGDAEEVDEFCAVGRKP